MTLRDFYVLQDGIRILQPFLIGEIVSYFQPGSTLSRRDVYIYAAVVSFSHILQLIVNPKYFFTCHHIALKMKVSVANLIYRKVKMMDCIVWICVLIKNQMKWYGFFVYVNNHNISLY